MGRCCSVGYGAMARGSCLILCILYFSILPEKKEQQLAVLHLHFSFPWDQLRTASHDITFILRSHSISSDRQRHDIRIRRSSALALTYMYLPPSLLHTQNQASNKQTTPPISRSPNISFPKIAHIQTL